MCGAVRYGSGAEEGKLGFISPWTSPGTCSLIVRLHKCIICFDLDMYFLIDNNITTTVVAINKLMHLVTF